MEAALAGLAETIQQLDDKSRQLLQKTFAQIQASFTQLFPQMFQGGQAQLQWTEDKDVLNAGIEILAHPPGKPAAKLPWLSGGEKTLTALAFIFAFFEHTPAPFCVLDEVDAPLDDRNVLRFAHWVKEKSKDLEFIVISHNKLTIQQADQLLGVTMPQTGISQVVPVDLQIATNQLGIEN